MHMATDTAVLERAGAGTATVPAAVSAADRPDTESTGAAAPGAVPWDWDWRQPPRQGDTDAAVARAAR